MENTQFLNHTESRGKVVKRIKSGIFFPRYVFLKASHKVK